MLPGSLRWRLSITYALIALLTTVILGFALVALLTAHFNALDADYLAGAGKRVVSSLRDPQSKDLLLTVRREAFTTNTRIVALDGAGATIADSGPPQAIDRSSISSPSGPGDKTELLPPAPRPDTIRSGATLSIDSKDLPAGITTLVLSDPPASSNGVMSTVVTTSLISALIAVVLAAIAGYVLAVSLTRPLQRLAKASDDMAAGDLTARADVDAPGEIGRLAHSFNAMADRVEAMVAELRRFVSDAAHELGTPLTALRTDLELLEDSADPDDTRRLAQHALSQEGRLETLTHSLLRLSRFDAKASEPQWQRFSVASFLSMVVDALSARAEQSGVDVSVHTDSGLDLVSDPARLQTAVESLLDNALKFTPEGGHVDVGAQTRGNEVVLWVHDSGPGIPAADREHVFDRFYRGRATAQLPGSGLGLALCQAAVTSIGGTVAVAESTSGTRMEITLPQRSEA